MEFKVVLFLCGLTIFTLADSCKYKITEGKRLEIKLNYPNLKDEDDLKWRKDNILKHHKRRGTKVNEGPGEKGSLVISSVKLEDSGIYYVEVYDTNGRQTFQNSTQVCVYENLQKPMVNFTCENNKIQITCNIFQKSYKSSYKWEINGKHNENEKQAKIIIKNQQQDHKYKCTISNPISNSSSDEVLVACSKPMLFGFDHWTMVIILAGGGGLVLMLTIVLMTCACYRCQRKKQQEKDEEELRLNNLPLQYGHPKSNQTARGQPAPPIPENEVSVHQKVEDSGKRNQRYVRPPPPPVDDDDDEQPPPLPQPRKKVHNKNNSDIVS